MEIFRGEGAFFRTRAFVILIALCLGSCREQSDTATQAPKLRATACAPGTKDCDIAQLKSIADEIRTLSRNRWRFAAERKLDQDVALQKCRSEYRVLARRHHAKLTEILAKDEIVKFQAGLTKKIAKLSESIEARKKKIAQMNAPSGDPKKAAAPPTKDQILSEEKKLAEFQKGLASLKLRQAQLPLQVAKKNPETAGLATAMRFKADECDETHRLLVEKSGDQGAAIVQRERELRSQIAAKIPAKPTPPAKG